MVNQLPCTEAAPTGSGKTILNLTEDSQSFVFNDVDSRPIPSLLRGFSAPVKLQCEHSNEELALLMAADSDAFNRWEAGQEISLRVALELLNALESGQHADVPDYFLNAFKSLLASDADNALLAEALILPGEETIGEKTAQMDMQQLFSVRRRMLKQLANHLEDELRQTYNNSRTQGNFSIDAEAIGKRSLKNACLSLLAHADARVGIELAETQFNDADNMTDEIAALRILSNDHNVDSKVYLDHFYNKWKNERLVVDKWFSLQAMSTREDTLANVKNLTKHSDFELTNPNRARSLLYAFSIGNPVRFHAEDGSGYAFLSDYIIELDKLNPQVAARMVGAMARWRRFTDNNQRLMQEQLQRILSTDNLSNDVYELVEKSLA